MAFEVSAEAYGQFMGRFSSPLAVQFIDFVGIVSGQKALDVGCGAGALTTPLIERLGARNVAAIDPSSTFVAALRSNHPDWDVRQGVAESMPFDDAQFDRTLAQLVVHFMSDPVAGLQEMARVTRPDGVVGACVWDHAGGAGPLALFWRAARDLDPSLTDESDLPGVREGHLRALFEAAGLVVERSTVLKVSLTFETFNEWWAPFTLGVGPAGEHVASLDADGREALRSRCEDLLPEGPFSVTAAAWAVCGARP